MQRAILLSTLAAVPCLAAGPAFALTMGEALTAVFGSDEVKDLAVPIFAGIGLFGALVFWIALSIGKRRQSREVEAYNTKLAAYSARLRRGGKA